MNNPKVSIVVPAYNGGELLGEAIQSVLDQTYTNFELIVVEDASPMPADAILARFHDPRIVYIVHPQNLGARKARKTAIQASSGDIIAYLDQDDLFHPQKLGCHVDYLAGHPDVGMSYNARFSVNDSPDNIREIWRPPKNLTLADAVLGFPVAPSEMVFRRNWGIRTEYQEGNWGRSGGEIVLLGRMMFDGCQFGYVDRALNYRRFHSGRVFKNLAGTCEAELRCQDLILSDTRCPPEVQQLRSEAYKNTYIYFGSRAFAQCETALGQEYYRKAVQLVPDIVQGKPCPLMEYLVDFVFEDESQDHQALLDTILAQLPPELAWINRQSAWSIACGYLMKGARAMMWGRTEDGKRSLRRAQLLCARLDEPTQQRLSAILLDYEAEYGAEESQKVLFQWFAHFDGFLDSQDLRHLEGSYLINQAFRSYRAGDFSRIAGEIARAVVDDPHYLVNRGVLSMIAHSLTRLVIHNES